MDRGWHALNFYNGLFVCGKIEFTDDTWGNNLRQVEIESKMAIAARRRIFHHLAEFTPVMVRKPIANLFPCKGSVFIAEHCDMTIDSRRVREEM